MNDEGTVVGLGLHGNQEMVNFITTRHTHLHMNKSLQVRLMQHNRKTKQHTQLVQSSHFSKHNWQPWDSNPRCSHFRQRSYQLSYRGSSAGWVQITHSISTWKTGELKLIVREKPIAQVPQNTLNLEWNVYIFSSFTTFVYTVSRQVAHVMIFLLV